HSVASLFPHVNTYVVSNEEAKVMQAMPASIKNRNPLPTKGTIFFAEPGSVPLRPDFCVFYDRMSDFAMYALILGIHPESRLAYPIITDKEKEAAQEIVERLGVKKGRTAFVTPRGRSWPFVPKKFWDIFIRKIKKSDWKVFINDEKE